MKEEKWNKMKGKGKIKNSMNDDDWMEDEYLWKKRNEIS